MMQPWKPVLLQNSQIMQLIEQTQLLYRCHNYYADDNPLVPVTLQFEYISNQSVYGK